MLALHTVLISTCHQGGTQVCLLQWHLAGSDPRNFHSDRVLTVSEVSESEGHDMGDHVPRLGLTRHAAQVASLPYCWSTAPEARGLVAPESARIAKCLTKNALDFF